LRQYTRIGRKFRLRNATLERQVNRPEVNDLLGLFGIRMALFGCSISRYSCPLAAAIRLHLSMEQNWNMRKGDAICG
jgi:hypothetical protein